MSRKKYFDEDVMALGRQFATSGEFLAAYPREWHAANRRKLLPIIFGAPASERVSAALIIWTFEAIAELCDQVGIKTPYQLLRVQQGAYSAACRKGWFKALFPHWVKRTHITHTYEQCAKAARRCRSRDEFKHSYGGQFQKSRRMGWYDAITAHLPDIYGGFDSTLEGAVYLIRFDGAHLTQPVFKIGITNQSAGRRIRNFRPVAGIRGTVIREVRFPDGAIAKTIEAEILCRYADQRYQGKKFLLKSGHTECIETDPSLCFDMLVYGHPANDGQYKMAA